MGILLVYDVCDERSFNSMGLDGCTDVDIRTWFQNVEQHATEEVHKILIGNKCDWTEKRVVSEDQGRALAQELGISFIETSAKSNINVEEAFFSLSQYYSTFPTTLQPVPSKSIPLQFANTSDIKKKLIDSAATTSGAGTNVNLDNKGQGKLGGGCCP
jgi:Ras-related protein Rab-8A